MPHAGDRRTGRGGEGDDAAKSISEGDATSMGSDPPHDRVCAKGNSTQGAYNMTTDRLEAESHSECAFFPTAPVESGKVTRASMGARAE